MDLRVLGCAGGIGGRERFTTCLGLDQDILLDAGTGLAMLDIEQLIQIDHVFLTHCHLDHVAGLPLLVDTVAGKRNRPIFVHATPEVLEALKLHLFNWVLWPDFAAIPSRDNPVLQWVPMAPESTIDLNGRLITSHRVSHTPGSVGYHLRSVSQPHCGFLFTGDMSTTPELWSNVVRHGKLSKVIVDCSFTNAEADLAAKSLHFCPQSLLEDILTLPLSTEFFIYHLKPGQEDQIMEELRQGSGGRAFNAIRRGDSFVL